MIRILIKKLNENAKLPQKMTEHSAGYDVYSCNDEDILLKSKSLELIPTGFSVAIPKNYEIQIRPRSGLVLKHQIGVLNSPGTIDADYRGEVKIILYNYSDRDFVVTKHMRIAQMVISKHFNADFHEVNMLPKSNRDKGGFGHTNL